MNPKYSSLKALNWKKLGIAIKTRTKQKLLRERYGTKRKNLKSKKRHFLNCRSSSSKETQFLFAEPSI